MVVVVLRSDSGDIIDVVGPFDTIELANDWATEQRDGDIASVGTQFENWYIAKP